MNSTGKLLLMHAYYSKLYTYIQDFNQIFIPQLNRQNSIISHTFHILIVLKAFFVRTCCFKANLIQDKWVSFSFAQVL